MTFSLHTLYLTAGGVPLSVIEGSITLDERRAPYAQGAFTVVTPTNSDALAALDARAGEVRGFARVDYRDGVTAADITGWVGVSVSTRKVTAAIAGRSLAQITAMHSAWGNPGQTFTGIGWDRGQEWESELFPFRLLVTGSRPDPIRGTTEIQVTSLETRLLDHVRLSDGPERPAGNLIEALVQDVLTAVDPSFVLSPVDDRYETVPPYFATTTLAQWKAGVAAWDFLDPILQTAGVTLQCTPEGQWRLVQANAPAFTTIGVPATNVDIRESREEWGDAVVVRYRWRDSNGNERMQTDFASLNAKPQRTIVIEQRDSPYPGPGAATTILRRVQNLAREITVEAVTRFREQYAPAVTRPGVGVSAFAGQVNVPSGRITAARFDWPTNRMTITARRQEV